MVDKFLFLDPHLKPCSANRHLESACTTASSRAADIRHTLNWVKFALWILTGTRALTLADPRLLHPTILLSIVYACWYSTSFPWVVGEQILYGPGRSLTWQNTREAGRRSV